MSKENKHDWSAAWPEGPVIMVLAWTLASAFAGGSQWTSPALVFTSGMGAVVMCRIYWKPTEKRRREEGVE